MALNYGPLLLVVARLSDSARAYHETFRTRHGRPAPSSPGSDPLVSHAFAADAVILGWGLRLLAIGEAIRKPK